MVINQTIITNFSLKKTELNRTKLIIINQTELLQFGFKTVSSGSIFFVRFNLAVRFGFFPPPTSSVLTTEKILEQNRKYMEKISLTTKISMSEVKCMFKQLNEVKCLIKQLNLLLVYIIHTFPMV
jgi:hypothetical protein